MGDAGCVTLNAFGVVTVRSHTAKTIVWDWARAAPSLAPEPVVLQEGRIHSGTGGREVV